MKITNKKINIIYILIIVISGIIGYIIHNQIFLIISTFILFAYILYLFNYSMFPTKNPILLFFRSGPFIRTFPINDNYHELKKDWKLLSIPVIIASLLLFALTPIIIPNYKPFFDFILNAGLSIILLSATFSILSFNYANVLKEKDKDIVIASGKRFLLATIYSVIVYIFLLVLASISQFLTVKYLTNFSFGVYAWDIFFLTVLILINSLVTTLYYLLEGFVLILKGTIQFNP
jgi:hypothetical protein